MLAGAVTLVAAGIGGLAEPASPRNPLVAMGAWPEVSLAELSAADNQDLTELADAARAAEARASRDGGRTGLDAKLAEQVIRMRQIQLEKAQAALIESKWAAQRTTSAAGFVLPTYNYQLTAHFGNSGRLWSRDHTGLDFAAPARTAVRAVAGGRVIDAGWAGAYGWRIKVKHWDDTETWYCHLSEILITGGTVEAGEKIGRVGSTGNSTGPHLHFEVHPDSGSAIDPEAWLSNHGLNPEQLAFRADRDLDKYQLLPPLNP